MINAFITSSYKTKALSEEEYVLIEHIVEKYNPIEVMNLKVQNDGLHDEIDDSFLLD